MLFGVTKIKDPTPKIRIPHAGPFAKRGAAPSHGPARQHGVSRGEQKLRHREMQRRELEADPAARRRHALVTAFVAACYGTALATIFTIGLWYTNPLLGCVVFVSIILIAALIGFLTDLLVGAARVRANRRA
ncbi:MAG: hypothetical protein AB7K09_21060 [Planctomycetota bacterium]